MREWVWWSLLAVLAWGLWGFLSARASNQGNAQGLLAGAVIMEGLFVLPYVGHVPRSISWWLVGVGAAGAVAYGAMFQALRTSDQPGAVVAVTSLYPAITLGLTVLFFKEEVTLRKLAGIGLALGAVLLLAERS